MIESLKTWIESLFQGITVRNDQGSGFLSTTPSTTDIRATYQGMIDIPFNLVSTGAGYANCFCFFKPEPGFYYEIDAINHNITSHAEVTSGIIQIYPDGTLGTFYRYAWNLLNAAADTSALGGTTTSFFMPLRLSPNETMCYRITTAGIGRVVIVHIRARRYRI